MTRHQSNFRECRAHLGEIYSVAAVPVPWEVIHSPVSPYFMAFVIQSRIKKVFIGNVARQMCKDIHCDTALLLFSITRYTEKNPPLWQSAALLYGKD